MKGRAEVVIVWLLVAFLVLLWGLAILFSCKPAPEEYLTQKQYDVYLDKTYGEFYAESLHRKINDKVLKEIRG